MIIIIIIINYENNESNNNHNNEHKIINIVLKEVVGYLAEDLASSPAIREATLWTVDSLKILQDGERGRIMNFQHFMGYRNIAGKIMDHPLRQNAKAKVVREYKWDTFYLFILFTGFNTSIFIFLKMHPYFVF